jgi:hypothetical protein
MVSSTRGVWALVCLLYCSCCGRPAGPDAPGAADARFGDAAALPEGGAAPDFGGLPDCAAMTFIQTPCAHEGDRCVGRCNVCSAGLYTTDPINLSCQRDPGDGMLKWNSYDSVDCYPMPGHCPQVFTDPVCTMPLVC